MAKLLGTLPDAPQALPADEVLAHFGVLASKGLADEEARHRLNVFGPTPLCRLAKPADSSFCCISSEAP
jgi:hypothetical protein